MMTSTRRHIAERRWGMRQPAERHATRREGDEQACSCGKRWPAGEAHP